MNTKLLALLVFIVLVAGCISQEGETVPTLRGKKALFIINQTYFRDEELTEPKKILENEGAVVKVASITTEEARGMLGLRVIPDIAVRNANPADYDVLVVVGGSGSPQLANYSEVLDVIRRFNEQEKPIASICLGPYVLARAGILDGKRATVFPADFALTELRRAGAKYVEENVVVDGKIITAPGPEAAKQFGEQIVKVLSQ